MLDLHVGRLRITMDQGQDWSISPNIGSVAAYSRARGRLREILGQLRVKGLEVNHLLERRRVLMRPSCPPRMGPVISNGMA